MEMFHFIVLRRFKRPENDLINLLIFYSRFQIQQEVHVKKFKLKMLILRP